MLVKLLRRSTCAAGSASPPHPRTSHLSWAASYPIRSARSAPRSRGPRVCPGEGGGGVSGRRPPLDESLRHHDRPDVFATHARRDGTTPSHGPSRLLRGLHKAHTPLAALGLFHGGAGAEGPLEVAEVLLVALVPGRPHRLEEGARAGRRRALARHERREEQRQVGGTVGGSSRPTPTGISRNLGSHNLHLVDRSGPATFRRCLHQVRETCAAAHAERRRGGGDGVGSQRLAA